MRAATHSVQPVRVASAARRFTIRPAWWGVALLAAVTLVLSEALSSYNLFIYDSVLLACMGAIALQLLQGTMGMPSVGNATFLLVGAFTAVFCVRAGIPFPGDAVVAIFVAGIGGLITGLSALRLKSLFLALSTLATYYIAVFAGQFYEKQVPGAADAGFFVPVLFSSYGLAASARYWAWLLFAIVAVVILLASRIMSERAGRAMRMIREHELVAPTLGISVPRYKLAILTLTSMLIGLQGALTAHFTGSVITDDFTLALSFQYVAIIIVGGLDSIAGAVIGAAVITVLPVWVPSIVKGFMSSPNATVVGPNVSLIIYGVLIVIFVTTSPGGLVGLLRAGADKVRSRLRSRLRAQREAL